MKNPTFAITLMCLSALTLIGCQAVPDTALTPIDTPAQTVVNNQLAEDSDGDGVSDDLDQCPATPANIIVDNRGCTIIIGPEKGLKMELRAYFNKDSSELLPIYFDQFDKAGIRMNEVDTATMRIEGNISKSEIESGSNQEIAMLTKNRALAIKNYLITNHNIAANRIMTFDCAANQQIAPNDSAEGRHMNRRIYALVTQTDERVIDNYLKYSASKACVKF